MTLNQTLAVQSPHCHQPICTIDMDMGEDGFRTLTDGMHRVPANELVYLDVAGNHIARAIHNLSQCLLSGALRNLRFLSLAGNGGPAGRSLNSSLLLWLVLCW